MMMKIMVSMIKPRYWIGLRPQESTNKKVTQYPGIKPAADKMRLPTQMLYKLSYTFKVPLEVGFPKPMTSKMIEELRPKP